MGVTTPGSIENAPYIYIYIHTHTHTHTHTAVGHANLPC
jgi:hypothetical protein